MRSAVLVIIVVVCGVAAAQAASGWKPAGGPLMTRWAADVSPDNVWPEYPRPQMVRDAWTNLNGLWDYAIRPRGEDLPAAWDGQILVPFPVESALSGVMKSVLPSQRLWYRRTFTAPETGRDGRLLVHFGAVDWQCTVWVNGTLVKRLKGYITGYVAMPLPPEAVAALKAGRNTIAVHCRQTTGGQYIDVGLALLIER